MIWRKVIKSIHLMTVAGSFLFFVVRFYWMLSASSMIDRQWVKISPHINDSILLISAIFLTFQINQFPIQDAWLSMKVVALLIYIGLGVIALKRGKTKNTRIIAGVFAMLIFMFMASVAVSKNPWGFI